MRTDRFEAAIIESRERKRPHPDQQQTNTDFLESRLYEL